MNAYFDKNNEVISNKRIMEAYFADSVKVHTRTKTVWSNLSALLISLWAILSSARVCRIARASAVALSLIALIGVVGAMETGALTLWAGLLIGLALVCVEYLCLRPRRS